MQQISNYIYSLKLFNNGNKQKNEFPVVNDEKLNLALSAFVSSFKEKKRLLEERC